MSFTAVDDGDPLSISSFAFSVAGAAPVPIDITDSANFAGSAITGLASSTTGATTTIIWDTGVSAAITASDVVLLVGVTDSLGAVSGVVASAPFSIDNTPNVALSVAAPAGSRWLDSVPVNFTIDAPFGDTVGLAFQFSVGGGAWQNATPTAGSPAIARAVAWR